jgi:1-deoxyxylulose-5-phosphate synthase
VLLLAGVGPDVDPERGTDLSPGRIERSVAAGVRRLGRVDALWARGVDRATPLEATLTALAAELEAGRLRGWGVSGIDVWQLDAWLSAADRASLPRPAFVRNRRNLFERGDERDLVPLATGEGLALLARAPDAGGRLTDRHIAAEEEAERAAAAGTPRTGDADPALPALLSLRALARERSVPTEALALAWLLGAPGATAVVVAPQAKADWDVVHEALGVDLDDEERERLDAVFS